MFKFKYCAATSKFLPKIKKTNFAVTVVTVLSVTIFVNLKLKSYNWESTENDVLKENGYQLANSRENRFRLSSTNQHDHVKLSKNYRTKNPWIHYHNSKNGFQERANTLAKSKILILSSHFDEISGKIKEYPKSSIHDEAHRINNFIDDEVPLYPREETNVSVTRMISWPECLCAEGSAALQGAECSPLQVPADAVHVGTEVGGACSWRAWRESTNRVISVSMYGPPSKYLENLHDLISGSPTHYPGWSVWIYLRHPNPREMCQLLQTAPHVFFCDTRALPALGDLKRTTPLMWKISPLGDPRVTAVYIRNLNRSPLAREAAAVQQWIQSNKTWHVMRDHPSQSLAIEGGQWGARWDSNTRLHAAALRNVLLVRTPPGVTADEANAFTSGAVWPHMERSNSLLRHDAFRCNESSSTGTVVSWPTQRFGNSYVGMGDAVLPLPACPERCRPHNHPEWSTC